MAVMTAQPPLPLIPTGARGRRGRGDRRGRRRGPGVRARQSGLCLGCRRHRGAPVRGGVVDADQGGHPARGRGGVRGDTAPVTRRWAPALSAAGVRTAPERKGPKRKSKLTAEGRRHRVLREQGLSCGRSASGSGCRRAASAAHCPTPTPTPSEPTSRNGF